MLGEQAWSELYVVIAALWPLTRGNVHEMIIGSQMSEEQRETHIIISEAAETLDDAKVLLGRIVGDRIASQYVFNPEGSLENREDIYSLSTQRDLLSRSAERALGQCPFATAARE